MIEHTVIDGIDGKVCGICGHWRPLGSYYKNRRSSDGLQSNCVACRRAMAERHVGDRAGRSLASYYRRHEKELTHRKALRAAMNEDDIIEDQSFHGRYWAKVKKGDGCWEWTAFISKGGYGQIGFRGGLIYSHRAAWILTNGPIGADLYVCHHCDNRKCCNPEHMFLGTFTDNMNDMLSKGRHGGTAGELHPRAKLTKVKVDEIRRRYADENILQEELANEYGVAKPTVAALLRNNSWYDPNYTPLPKRIKMSGPNNPNVKGDTWSKND